MLHVIKDSKNLFTWNRGNLEFFGFNFAEANIWHREKIMFQREFGMLFMKDT